MSEEIKEIEEVSELGEVDLAEEKLQEQIENRLAKDLLTESSEQDLPDVETIGNPDPFKLVCMATSKNKGWSRSVEAMQLPHGCMINTITKDGDNVTETSVFVPGIVVTPVAPNDDSKGHKFTELP